MRSELEIQGGVHEPDQRHALGDLAVEQGNREPVSEALSCISDPA